ncbi:expressed protein [Dictyostelium purpureum]|uniref:Expressed protein n=1 Tax=Dictyostelium purpureum TaxID=5786 RepID=F0ZYQ3_DICPU|nr:uncharacterized protein DICPUDRAFT_99381 [Dictyostelium purpureum]EGC30918.1 expressed protein [Dictyostelium purpureum]|eukprot:XP_003292547.1 expressed protein [Dictyostelium purpureum]
MKLILLLFLIYISCVLCSIEIIGKALLDIRYDSGNCQPGTETEYKVVEFCNALSKIETNSSGVYMFHKEKSDGLDYCFGKRYGANKVHLGKCIKLGRDYPESIKTIWYDPQVYSSIFNMSAALQITHLNSLCENKNRLVTVMLLDKVYRSNDHTCEFRNVSSDGINVYTCKDEFRNGCNQTDFYPFGKGILTNGYFVSFEPIGQVAKDMNFFS